MLAVRFALFTLLVGGLAGLGAFAWYANHVSDTAVVEAPAPKITILVASHPLRVGSLVKPEDLTSTDVASNEAAGDAKRDTPAARAELIGALVRRSIEADQPILPASVMRPGDYGFLAAVLTPGMRASTIGIDAVSGSAGLIWPGDHVDVILTQLLDDPNLPPGRKVSAETLLSDARVIAIDQQLAQGATAAATDQTVRTATLEVTPEQAERIAVATRLGHLSLDLRSATPAGGPGQPGSAAAAAAAGSSGSTSGSAPAPGHDAIVPGTAAQPPSNPVPGVAAGTLATANAGSGTGPGNLALSGASEPHGVTWGSDVSAALGGAPVAAPHPSVRVFSGAHDGKEVKF